MAISAEVVGQGGSSSDVQSDGGAESFDFGSLRESALAAFGSEDTPAGEPSEEHVEQPSAQQTAQVAEPTKVADASARQLAQLKPDDLVEVVVDGQKVTLPWSEAQGGVMRQAKFTKSMQELAAERRQLQESLASVDTLRQQREALVALVSNEQLLQQFLVQKYPHLVRQAEAAAATTVNPDDIATVGQIEAVKAETARQIQSLMEEFRQQVRAESERVTTDIEDRQASAKLGLEINTTISGMFKEHPYIETLVPNAEQMLRYEVLKLNPQTEQETLEAFKTVFGGWVENYKKVVAESNKDRVIQKQKLLSNNIQPPGGAPVQPKAESFMKKTRSGQIDIDWDKLRATGKEMLG